MDRHHVTKTITTTTNQISSPRHVSNVNNVLPLYSSHEETIVNKNSLNLNPGGMMTKSAIIDITGE